MVNYYGMPCFGIQTNFWFVGRALANTGNEVTSESVHQTTAVGKNFKVATNFAPVPISNVLLQVEPPIPVSSLRGCYFKLQVEDFENIKKVLKSAVNSLNNSETLLFYLVS